MGRNALTDLGRVVMGGGAGFLDTELPLILLGCPQTIPVFKQCSMTRIMDGITNIDYSPQATLKEKNPMKNMTLRSFHICLYIPLSYSPTALICNGADSCPSPPMYHLCACSPTRQILWRSLLTPFSSVRPHWMATCFKVICSRPLKKI